MLEPLKQLVAARGFCVRSLPPDEPVCAGPGDVGFFRLSAGAFAEDRLRAWLQSGFRAKAVIAERTAAHLAHCPPDVRIFETPVNLDLVDEFLRNLEKMPSRTAAPQTRQADNGADLDFCARLLKLQREACFARTQPQEVLAQLSAIVQELFSPGFLLLSCHCESSPRQLFNHCSWGNVSRSWCDDPGEIHLQLHEAGEAEAFFREHAGRLCAQAGQGTRPLDDGGVLFFRDKGICGCIAAEPCPDLSGGRGAEMHLVAETAVQAFYLACARHFCHDLAFRDELTGLYNRRFFMDVLHREIVRQKRRKSPFVVAILDADDLKKLNDRHGHAAGDALLRAVAEAITGCIRKSDYAARLGGDEFTIIMPDTTEAKAQMVLRRILASLKAEGRRVGRSYTCAYGLAEGPGTSDSAEALLEQADQALIGMKQRMKTGRIHTARPAGAGVS